MRTWQKRPPLVAAQNPLLGRWDSRGSGSASAGQARANNDLARLLGPGMAGMTKALLGGITQGLCDSMLGRGLLEFRANAVVAIGRDRREQLKYHVPYRGGGSRVVALPQDAATFTHMIVNFQSPDHALVAGVGCALARARGAGVAGPVQESPGASPHAVSQRQANQADVAADVATLQWAAAGSKLKGESDF